MRFSFLAILTFALILPASAQALGGISNNGAMFTVSVNPQYQVPYSQATISLLSTTLDLANTTMNISVSGKNIYQGNVQPVAIQIGAAGIVASVKVTVTSAGVDYTQMVSIQPQDIALVAEPISSAPSLYQGKSLVPIEGNVRVVAIANMRSADGKVLDPSTLSYVWTVDNTRIADVSGIGKDAILVASPLEYRARSVSVVVTSQDKNLIGGADFSLTAQEPSVRIYKNDPLLGILYDHALSGQYAISDAEDAFYAAPFSLPTTSSVPLLQWFLNGNAAQTGNVITLRPTGGGQGTASLSLVASAGDSAIATENLSLSFGAASNTSFFGL